MVVLLVIFPFVIVLLWFSLIFITKGTKGVTL